jgi:hypothetical protein
VADFHGSQVMMFVVTMELDGSVYAFTSSQQRILIAQIGLYIDPSYHIHADLYIDLYFHSLFNILRRLIDLSRSIIITLSLTLSLCGR